MNDIIHCLNCHKVVDPPKKGKKKVYCNVTCRSNHWQKEQRKLAKLHRPEKVNIVWANEEKTKVAFEPNENGRYNYFIPTQQPIDKFGAMPLPQDYIFPKNIGIDKIKAQYPIHEIEKQIQAIRDEKIPKERDTRLGRFSWQADQEKRIKELQSKLK